MNVVTARRSRSADTRAVPVVERLEAYYSRPTTTRRSHVRHRRGRGLLGLLDGQELGGHACNLGLRRTLGGPAGPVAADGGRMDSATLCYPLIRISG